MFAALALISALPHLAAVVIMGILIIEAILEDVSLTRVSID